MASLRIRPVAALGAVVSLATAASAAEDVVCIRQRGKARNLVVRADRCRPTEIQLGSFTALQKLLAALELADEGKTLRLSSVNLQVVSGSGSTPARPTAPAT